MGMRKTQPDKRARLIETAMKLAYRNGFRETSLADIAQAAHHVNARPKFAASRKMLKRP